MIERLRVQIQAGVAGEFFFSPDVRSTPVLPQWHVKDPGHSAKTTGGRLHLKQSYALDPKKSQWADYAAVQA